MEVITMSKRYSADTKKITRHLLETNGGNVELTSHQTGVPPRTLRDWRREYAIQSPQQKEMRRRRQEAVFSKDADSDDLSAQFKILRTRMMDEALNIANSLSEDSNGLSLNQRVIALSRLLDRLLKLNIRFPAPKTEVVVIEYGDDDDLVSSDDDEDDDL
jgi:transposase-like protein